MSKTIKFKKLDPRAVIPSYAYDGDIGLDVTAITVDYDKENDCFIYGTGLACETEGHMGVLGMMKSSIYKHGDAYLANAVGLIDSDTYRGEIKYVYKNRTPLDKELQDIAEFAWENEVSFYYKLFHSKKKFVLGLKRILMLDPCMFAPYDLGEKIGQLVPLTFDTIDIQEVIELSDTERGDGGFGSTDENKIDSTDSSDSTKD